MGKKILLAGSDEKYIVTLEKSLVAQLGTNYEIHVVTDVNYLAACFATPQNYDVVIMDELLFGSEMNKHNLGFIFLLTEEQKQSLATNINFIYKYLGADEIVRQIIHKAALATSQDGGAKSAKSIFVYSPIGGSGQTSIATGLALALAQHGARVLLITLDSLQSGGLLAVCPLQTGAEKALVNKSNYVYQTIKPLIVNTGIDIVPPFAAPLDFLGLKAEHFTYLIDVVKKSGDYDTIVVDGPDDFSTGTTSMMADTDHTILVTMADDLSAKKFNTLLQVIDCSDQNRFSLVCNRFCPQEQQPLNLAFPVEYISEHKALSPDSWAQLGDIPELKKVALALM